MLKNFAKRLGIYSSARTIYRALRHPRLYLIEQREKRARHVFYAQHIKRGMLCFDIGANFGNRSEIFLQLGAQVVAVEPQPICIEFLKNAFGTHPSFTLVEKALGDHQGEAELMLSDNHTLSTMSQTWINRMRSSGRFGDAAWNQTMCVGMTTVDNLIAEYGIPDFCKIDVEGFELNVLKGLSQPLKLLSLEFAPENLDATIQCIQHLSTLGRVKFNYSLGESMQLELTEWIGPEAIASQLIILPADIFGDLYVRFDQEAAN